MYHPPYQSTGSYVNAALPAEPHTALKPCHAVLQGVRDDVVDISAGHALHAAALHPVAPLWAQDCDHQNVETDPQYVTRLKDFIKQVFK